MLRGGEAVLAAVSGGADSVALLDALRVLAPSLGLTLHAVHVDHGLRPESAADAAVCVATTHTADDQAETVVMRLLDGAGPRGLGGIAPVRSPYIRPLLETRRHQVEAHLIARGQPWREDASNADPRFVRNRIRHDVLPFLVAH